MAHLDARCSHAASLYTDAPDPAGKSLPAGPIRVVSKVPPPWCEGCRHRGLSAFTDLSKTELAHLSRLKENHGVASTGDVISRQGEPMRQILTLYSGYAAKYRTLTSGKKQLLRVLLPGDIIGLEAALGRPSWYSVEALTDVSLCLFDGPRMTELLGVPSLAIRLFERAMRDQKESEERLAVLAGCDLRARLAYWVLNLHQRLRQRQLAHADSFTMPLTRLQMAEALGITTVHLYRTLRSFSREGLLRVEGHRFTILDAERLREISPVALEELKPIPLF